MGQGQRPAGVIRTLGLTGTGDPKDLTIDASETYARTLVVIDKVLDLLPRRAGERVKARDGLPEWARASAQRVYATLGLTGTGDPKELTIDASETYARTLVVIDKGAGFAPRRAGERIKRGTGCRKGSPFPVMGVSFRPQLLPFPLVPERDL